MNESLQRFFVIIIFPILKRAEINLFKFYVAFSFDDNFLIEQAALQEKDKNQ